jgi:ABC-2 type transport system ATP-binding protein
MSLEFSGKNIPLGNVSVSIERVAKSYGTLWALNGVNTTIARGEIRGLLGANGSGKSTLMKILLGLVKPDNGRVRVEGIDPAIQPIPVRQMVGYVPETPRLYDFLSGIEYLDFVADLYGLTSATKKERIDEYLSAFDLRSQGNDLLSGYSLGMRQKIAISAALIHKPQILIFDEALNGLDPKTAKIVKDTLVKLASTGVTIIFSTHVLEIAQAICQKITILEKGRVIAEGTMQELQTLARGGENNSLENIFLSLTGSSDVRAIVEELTT